MPAARRGNSWSKAQSAQVATDTVQQWCEDRPILARSSEDSSDLGSVSPNSRRIARLRKTEVLYIVACVTSTLFSEGVQTSDGEHTDPGFGVQILEPRYSRVFPRVLT